MRYYAEFGGGLGDVFQQIFTQGLYTGFSRLADSDTVEVAIISHNPHVSELLAWHPNRKQMEVREFRYWLAEQDSDMRRQHGLPPYRGTGEVYVLKDTECQPTFYPSPGDVRGLAGGTDTGNAIIFSTCAGLPDRDIPAPIVTHLAGMAIEAGFIPVFVGRTYERFERGERWRDSVPPGCVNLIDRLSVPGVARLVQSCVGVVCCHSAISMLGWYLRKPQFLLYPPSVVERHFKNRDQWSFGLSFQECFHECFTEPSWETQADGFFDYLTVLRNASLKSGHRTAEPLPI